VPSISLSSRIGHIRIKQFANPFTHLGLAHISVNKFIDVLSETGIASLRA
jgi:hypothetical protein